MAVNFLFFHTVFSILSVVCESLAERRKKMRQDESFNFPNC